VVTLLIVPMSARPVPPAQASGNAGATLAVAGPLVASAPGPYRITPERRALLNTIRYAEGTWKGDSAAGYQVLYGGGRFSDLSRHPEIIVRRTYTSAAAGAYQFLPGTWKRAAQNLRLRDFRPPSQDQAALHLVEQRGALQAFDRQGLSAEVLARLAPEWASLPTLQGQSHYGQPVKSREELRRFYEREVERQRRLQRA
jgi:muramidase (phage lysozyme)